jgi:hypothetical protein
MVIEINAENWVHGNINIDVDVSKKTVEVFGERYQLRELENQWVDDFEAYEVIPHEEPCWVMCVVSRMRWKGEWEQWDAYAPLPGSSYEEPEMIRSDKYSAYVAAAKFIANVA